jgi:quinoprotein glucose dehydrogenase
MRSAGVLSLAFLAAFVLIFSSMQHLARAHSTDSSQESRDWPVYGGSPEFLHYSPLTQINRSNVNQLRVAWTYDSGE